MQNQTLTQPTAPQEIPRDPREATEQEYVGSTHWSSILDDIHDLKVVLNGSSACQDEEVVNSEASTLSRELIFGSSNDYLIKHIIADFLPSKVEVDCLLAIYFRGEAFIIPFIHASYFQRQYREFWADPTNVNPLWLSLLFSVCCMATSIRQASGLCNTFENDALSAPSAFHLAAGQCLVAGQYHRPQQLSVEALAMYAHCKNMKSLDPSREAGAILGMVVRMAYEMGYHRDPDSFGSFTIFEGEMRRRFWAACKQVDLMISFQLGLPSNIRPETCDTKSPSNLLDLDFDVDTQVLPASRSENEATGLLWFIVKDRLIVGFGKVWQDALSFKGKSEAEILEFDEEIQQMHMTIPEILRVRPLSESITDAPFLILTRVYVELIYLKSLCVLHRKYMARGNNFSTKSCIEAGTKIVNHVIDMHREFSTGGQLYTERWMFNNFTMNDFLLGVMILCLVLHTRWKRNGSDAVIDITKDREILGLLEQSHAICVEKSKASRDAQRVAHAVSLTLRSSNSAAISDQTDCLDPAASLSEFRSNTDELTGTEIALMSSNHGYEIAQNDETAFGFLDPFNFMGHDIESIDWTVFESQISSQPFGNGIL